MDVEEGWERFEFGLYDVAELDRCRRRFLADVRRVWELDDREAMAEFVLDWFADSASDPALAIARPSRDTWRAMVTAHGMSLRSRRADAPRWHHWMADLVHTGYARPGSWRVHLNDGVPCPVYLALEVGFGKRDQVLDNAARLAALRARSKVIVTGVEAPQAPHLGRDLVRLRYLTDDPAPWLWINLARTRIEECTSRLLED
jgi:hypothetical protein